MHLLSLKFLSILLILFTVVITGWYPFKRHLQGFNGRKFTGSEALAAGIFLGAAIMHMLPDAQIGFVTHHIQYPFAFLIAGISFLTLLLMEHVARENYQVRPTSSATSRDGVSQGENRDSPLESPSARIHFAQAIEIPKHQDIQMHRIVCPLLATFILSVHSFCSSP